MSDSETNPIPSDDEIRSAASVILQDCDLEVTTLKTIKVLLEKKFDCVLSGKKDIIREALESFILNNDGDADGEEEEAEEGTPKEKKKSAGGFTKPMQLSNELSEFMGQHTMGRTDVTKRIWNHIRENNLQDPKDRRVIVCDEAMLKVFKKKSFTMFKMTKYLSAMMKSVADLTEAKEEPASSSSKKRKAVKDDEESSSSSSKKKVKLEKGSFKGKAADSSSKTKGATFTKKGSESSKPKKKVKVENGEGGEKKPNGLNKEMAVSGDLAKVIMCGEAASRPQVVKKMWEYIKEHSLQNPSDKREILLNSALRGVFKVKSFTMFAMNKHLSDYLSPLP